MAVSGENVAFVALVLYSIFELLRFHRILAALSSLAGLVLYMLVSGSTASVVRATIMAAVVLLGSCFERKSDIVNSISIAALLLLLWNTDTLYDVGFQLSFAAVGSIIYFYPKLIDAGQKIPVKIRDYPFAGELMKLFAVSLAAQIGTLPFTAYYFGKISFVSCIANIIVVPVSGLNTILGFIEIMAAPLSYDSCFLLFGSKRLFPLVCALVRGNGGENAFCFFGRIIDGRSGNCHLLLRNYRNLCFAQEHS